MKAKMHKLTITLNVSEYTLADTLHELACRIDNAGEGDDLSEMTIGTAEVKIEGWREYSDNA